MKKTTFTSTPTGTISKSVPVMKTTRLDTMLKSMKPKNTTTTKELTQEEKDAKYYTDLGNKIDNKLGVVNGVFQPDKPKPVVELGLDGQPKPETPPTPSYDRKSYEDILAKSPNQLTEQDRGYLRVIQSRINEGKTLEQIFGEAPVATATTDGMGSVRSQIDAEYRKLQDTTLTPDQKAEVYRRISELRATPPTPEDQATMAEADLAVKKTELAQKTATATEEERQRLELQKQRDLSVVQEASKKRADAFSQSVAFSGFGRSTYSATKKDEIARDLQDQEVMIGRKMNEELALFEARRAGADAETISGLQANIDKIKQEIATKSSETKAKTLELNTKNGAKGIEALNTMLATLSNDEMTTLQGQGFDQKKSAELGYFVNAQGNIIYDENGKPIQFEGGVASEYGPELVDAYAQQVINGAIKLSDNAFDDIGLRNSVIKAMAGKSIGGVADKIRATQLLKQSGITPDDTMVNFIAGEIANKGFDAVKAEYGQEKLRDYTAGNQKILDDIRADIKSFADIKGSYTNLDSLYNNFMTSGGEKERAALEQAMGVLFQKMLDPGSVVREGEFDRTMQAQGPAGWTQGMLTRLSEGGLGLTDATLKQLVDVSKTLYKTAEGNVNDMKNTYKDTAYDLGADPKFVDKYFDRVVGGGEDREIQSIFGEDANTSPGTFKTSSGFNFDFGFNTPDQTGSTKGNTELISKYPNEASFKNNNPTGITWGISERTKGLLDNAGVKYTKGTSRPKAEGGNYIAFDTVEDGMKAYKILLTQAGTDDVYSRLKQWVGTSEGDSYAKTLMSQSGIPQGTKFSDLDEGTLDKLLTAQLKKESPNFYKEIVAKFNKLNT